MILEYFKNKKCLKIIFDIIYNLQEIIFFCKYETDKIKIYFLIHWSIGIAEHWFSSIKSLGKISKIL